jgi:hypothetical protein
VKGTKELTKSHRRLAGQGALPLPAGARREAARHAGGHGCGAGPRATRRPSSDRRGRCVLPSGARGSGAPGRGGRGGPPARPGHCIAPPAPPREVAPNAAGGRPTQGARPPPRAHKPPRANVDTSPQTPPALTHAGPPFPTPRPSPCRPVPKPAPHTDAGLAPGGRSGHSRDSAGEERARGPLPPGQQLRSQRARARAPRPARRRQPRGRTGAPPPLGPAAMVGVASPRRAFSEFQRNDPRDHASPFRCAPRGATSGRWGAPRHPGAGKGRVKSLGPRPGGRSPRGGRATPPRPPRTNACPRPAPARPAPQRRQLGAAAAPLGRAVGSIHGGRRHRLHRGGGRGAGRGRRRVAHRQGAAAAAAQQRDHLRQARGGAGGGSEGGRLQGSPWARRAASSGGDRWLGCARLRARALAAMARRRRLTPPRCLALPVPSPPPLPPGGLRSLTQTWTAA